MKFEFQRVANMVYLVGEGDIVFKAWMADEFTERKKENAKKSILKGNPRAVFVN